MNLPSLRRIARHLWTYQCSDNEDKGGLVLNSTNSDDAQLVASTDDTPTDAAPRDDVPNDDVPTRNGPNNEAMLNRMRSVLRPLTKYEGNYIDDEKLQNTTSLVSTWISTLHLQVAKPWELCQDLELDYEKRPADPKFGSPQSIAARAWLLIGRCLQDDFEGLPSGLMQRLTDWAQVNHPEAECLHRFGAYRKYEWQLEGIFRPCLECEDRICDASTPHVSGFVTDRATHRHDALLTNELTSALYMAIETALITSPIVDFEDGMWADKNESKFFTILSWIIGRLAQ